MKTESFRSATFRIAERPPHFAYSLSMCDEERDFREQHWNVQPGDIVLDVGASYGAYTLSALAAGAAKVYAFEPEHTVANGLLANLFLNEWMKRAVVFDCGLWDKDDESVRFDSYAPHWPAGTADVPFRMIRLDTWAARRGIDRLDWMKLDVEGAEIRALRGGLETLRKFGPQLIVEAHTFMDATLPAQVRELLDWYEWEEVERAPCVMMVGRVRNA